MTEVRIQQSFLLNNRFELPTAGLSDIVAAYQEAWRPKAKKVIKGLEQVTGLNFAENYIDAYIANPDDRTAISHPLIIGGGFKPREFVYVLTHELVHSLADDNEQSVNWHEVSAALFHSEKWPLANHVMVHAVLEAYYTDVLNNIDHVLWDIRFRRSYPMHTKAWEIVTLQGYQNILAQLKASQFVTDKRFADSRHDAVNKIKKPVVEVP